MKLALGFFLRNEMFLMPKVLELLAGQFDGVVADDYGSTDGTVELLRDRGVQYRELPWENYSTARKRLYDRASELGYDYVLQLDGDEVIWPFEVARLRKAEKPFGALRRINLLPGGNWLNHSYPDWQTRFFQCGHSDLRWEKAVHEFPLVGSLPVFLGGQCDLLPVNIFHYGLLKPTSYIWLKNNNYNRIENGEQPDWTLTPPSHPDGLVLPTGVPFLGKLPI